MDFLDGAHIGGVASVEVVVCISGELEPNPPGLFVTPPETVGALSSI